MYTWTILQVYKTSYVYLDNFFPFPITLFYCSAWPRLKLNTKIGLHTTHHPLPTTHHPLLSSCDLPYFCSIHTANKQKNNNFIVFCLSLFRPRSSMFRKFDKLYFHKCSICNKTIFSLQYRYCYFTNL